MKDVPLNPRGQIRTALEMPSQGGGRHTLQMQMDFAPRQNFKHRTQEATAEKSPLCVHDGEGIERMRERDRDWHIGTRRARD